MYNPTLFTFGAFINSQNTAPIIDTMHRTMDPQGQMSMCTVTASVGNGKTHLMRAVTCAASQQNISNLFVRAGELNGNIPELLEPQVLAIDDLDTLSVSPAEDKTLADILEDRMLSGRKTFFAADPKQLQKQMASFPRVGARISWGPRFIIPQPEPHVVKLLIEQVFKEQLLEINSENVRTLTNAIIGHDMRTIIQLILTVAAYMQHTSTFNTAMHQIMPKLPLTVGVPITDVIQETAKYYQLAPSDITGDGRTKMVARARHVAMYIAKDLNKQATWQNLAAGFNKDHSSFMHAVSRVKDRLREERNLQEDIDYMTAMLRVRHGRLPPQGE